MNAISILKKASAITEGWTRTALNIRTSIQDHRLENYCKKCPVSHENGVYKGTCLKENGGCGCNAAAKTAQDYEGCPKHFFANNWFKPEEFATFIKENPIK
jgi:hypothetical protein